jgi:hypothetical protein
MIILSVDADTPKWIFCLPAPNWFAFIQCGVPLRMLRIRTSWKVNLLLQLWFLFGFSGMMLLRA